MNFKSTWHFIMCSLLLILTACSDSDNEQGLVDLFDAASLDITAINFPAGSTENTISINTFFDYTLEGLKSNGVDVIPITTNTTWSLSAGAISTIDQNGRLSAGATAENITITAQVGTLVASTPVRISSAKFNRVTQLNATPVSVNMCQTQQIKPIGEYIEDDGITIETPARAVDSSIINTITWIIRNAEDNSPSQRALVVTTNNITELQALETGDVIIQAQALSLINSGTVVVTSDDFNQTLDHNLNSIKVCLESDTDLATCTLANTDLPQNNVISLIAVGNYQAGDGSSFNRNITAYSKWGSDNTSNASIALSADRQQLDVTGNLPNTTVNISTACGNIEQTVSDNDLSNGVVLGEAITCATGNTNCLFANNAINIVNNTLTGLSVTANGTDLIDSTALVLTTQPNQIAFVVTANFSNNTSQDITIDPGINYNNQDTTVLTEVANSPGEYTVVAAGNAEVQIIFQSQVFTARITVPN
ncbi:hypothetical protein MNBD_GAMMA11-3464 [hydrothermal vent metagenome]|uniref:BIG2 domain-containing protein n=1 Tax=hydrothermal vent metagenome TaxID=652676 RepID=A0A3B0XFI4_9ZZZZ